MPEKIIFPGNLPRIDEAANDSSFLRGRLGAFKMAIAALYDHIICTFQAAPFSHGRRLAFQFLVNREKVFDFSFDMREDIVERFYLVAPWISKRHRKNFMIDLVAIDHVENTNRPYVAEASREARIANHSEDVERIAILCDRARNETVVAGIMNWGVQRAAQFEHAQRVIELIFVAGVLRNFHHHSQYPWKFRAGIGIEMVQHAFREQKRAGI